MFSNAWSIWLELSIEACNNLSSLNTESTDLTKSNIVNRPWRSGRNNLIKSFAFSWSTIPFSSHEIRAMILSNCNAVVSSAMHIIRRAYTRWAESMHSSLVSAGPNANEKGKPFRRDVSALRNCRTADIVAFLFCENVDMFRRNSEVRTCELTNSSLQNQVANKMLLTPNWSENLSGSSHLSKSCFNFIFSRWCKLPVRGSRFSMLITSSAGLGADAVITEPVPSTIVSLSSPSSTASNMLRFNPESLWDEMTSC